MCDLLYWFCWRGNTASQQMESIVKTVKSQVIVLKEFFGYRQGDGLKEFNAELKQLSTANQLELAQLAAVQLGYTAEQVNFAIA